MIIAFGVLTLQAQDTTVVQKYKPVNNYSGLNSLMKRLANPSWNGTPAQIGTGLKLEQGTISPLNGTSQNATTSPVTSSGSYAGRKCGAFEPVSEGDGAWGSAGWATRLRLLPPCRQLHHGFCAAAQHPGGGGALRPRGPARADHRSGGLGNGIGGEECRPGDRAGRACRKTVQGKGSPRGEDRGPLRGRDNRL